MSISENIKSVKSKIPESVRLVAVSKTKPNSDITEAYNSGHKIFGENKVQDLVKKYEELPKDIEWHFIGHLQRNKVKFIVPFVSMIHAVDSLRLMTKINEEAKKCDKKIKCLLQFHIAEESTKFGLDREEVCKILESEEYRSFNNITISGLMGMATYTSDTEKIRKEFRKLKDNFNILKERYFKENVDFKEISMGMSGDFELAAEEGSTMIRVGSIIFGDRNY